MKSRREKASAIAALGSVLLWVAAVMAPSGLRAEGIRRLYAPEQLREIQQGIDHVYNMEFAKAREIFEQMTRRSPDDPTGYAYLAYGVWVEALNARQELTVERYTASHFFSQRQQILDVDPAVEARFRELTRLAVEKGRQRLQQNPGDETAAWALGLTHQNEATYEASKRNWWDAFLAGRKTLRYHRELMRRHPDLYDGLLAVGVYHYVAGSMSWHTKFVAFFVGFSGDKETGKRELEKAAQNSVLAANDARVVLALIYSLEKDYARAYAHLERMRDRYPGNYLLRLEMAGQAMKAERFDTAREMYQDLLNRKRRNDPALAPLETALLYGRLGVLARERGDHSEAAQHLERAITQAGPATPTRTIALLELGKTLDLMGERVEAAKRYAEVLKAKDVVGTRQEAERLLRKPFQGEK
jgi:tetratricopeptide (TPR) repeat protein